MDINQVMGELDALFDDKGKAGQISAFLEEHIALAEAEPDNEALLMLYNEAIGFFRETGEYDKAVSNCYKAIELADKMNLQGTLPYATTLLNIANAHRAAGLLQDSLGYYNRVLPIYDSLLEPDNMYYAGLYNNISLLYQEMSDFKSAKEYLEKALDIVIKKKDAQFEIAVTHANLANTCIELGEDDEAKARAEEAIRIFEEIGVDDAHYSAALSALGSLYYMDKNYKAACDVMEKSRDCVAKYLGTNNIQYKRLSENIAIIRAKLETEQPPQEKASEENQPEEASAEQPVHVEADLAEYKTAQNEAIPAECEPMQEAADSAEREPEQVEADLTECEPEQTEAIPAEHEPEQVVADPAEHEPVQVVADPAEHEPEQSEADLKEQEPSQAEADFEELEPSQAEAVPAEHETPQEEKDISEDQPLNEERNTTEAPTLQEETLQEQSVEESQTEQEQSATEPQSQQEPVATELPQQESSAEPVPIAAYEDLTPPITGLELCRRYYEEYGKPMIAEKFPEYEKKIAVGLVGKGSDCFGFDDRQSADHDFGPRFVMWLTRENYERIGAQLQRAYDELPTTYMGYTRNETFHGRDRAGVMAIEDFYKNILGYDLFDTLEQNGNKENLSTIKCWLAIHDYALAAAVNGEVFRDDEGIFTEYRKRLLKYYPKPVWYRKIAQACAMFSQSGQYNLPRMQRRGQLVSAELAKAECMRYAMKLAYLLNRKYSPHDKWLFKGLPDNPKMCVESFDGSKFDVTSLLEKMSLLSVASKDEQELAVTVEALAVIFANELERLNIVGKSNVYLDANTAELTAKSDALLTTVMAETPVVSALSLSIAKAEFEAFDKVQNEGGRASCQNNWPTFKVMRMSQYMTWSEDMLLQYLYEFKTNYANGRNMIEEKYARMMESTAPLEYARFADFLPPLSEEKKNIIENIVRLQVRDMEDFAKRYPRLAGNARIIHTRDDLPYDTSYETYLRGELGTYSDKMLDMYGRYIVSHAHAGKNVAQEIMENTIHFYGYKTLDEAEKNTNEF